MKRIGDEIREKFPELSPHWEERERNSKPNSEIQEVDPDYVNRVINPEKSMKSVSVDEGSSIWKKYADEDTQKAWKKDFQITDQNRELLKYIMDKLVDPDFKKGFFLIGKPGSGKSAIMRIFSRWVNRFHNLEHRRYRVVSVIDIVSQYSEGGEDAISQYKTGNWCFDDLGAEGTQAMYMGNRKNVMADILQMRYNNLRNGIQTHLTGNITKNMIEELYGFRIASRMSEMFQVKVLGSGKDYVDFRKANSE